jgi:signal transduction histidine kinase
MVDKTTQAFDLDDNRIYSYSDKRGDTIPITKGLLEQAKAKQYAYFTLGNRDGVAYHHEQAGNNMVIITAAYDEDGLRNLHQLRMVLLACFFGGVMITLIAGYLFSAGILNPIRKITDEVNDISAQNLARRIQAGSGQDEWNYLRRTLNNLLDRLGVMFETQARFIANASHELSTPLTSISSQLEVSLQKERTSREYRDVMQSVLFDVSHLNKLTQMLLQVAKTSGNRSGIDIAQIRIDEIVLRIPHEISKINPGYTVRLNFDGLPDEETNLLVLGNEDLLLSAIKNIVINACKYSGDHSAHVSLSVQGTMAVLKVVDRGKGMSKDVLQHIFQPFYRDKSVGMEGGFGLGLSLSSRIIKLQRGRITAESEPGKGSVFTIYLPVGGGR